LSYIALSRPQFAQAFSRPWIFGSRADLTVSIGGTSTGFLLVILLAAFRLNVVLVWFVWTVTLDTPHFFATYFRTYLDKEERWTSRRLLLGLSSVFLIGPAVLTLCGILYGLGIAQFRLPWLLFTTAVVGAWASFHVIRQHYGILRLYNRKGGERGSAEARLDAIVLYGCLGLALLGVALRVPEARESIGLGPLLPAPAMVWTSPVRTFINLPADLILLFVSILATALLVTCYVAFQVRKFIRGRPVNLPKIVFLATVIFLHCFVAFSSLLPMSSILGFVAITTIYHDIQYFCIVWFYAKNRYGDSQDPRRQYGVAGVLSKSFVLFFTVGVLTVSLPIWGFGCLINLVPVCATGPELGAPTFMGHPTWIMLFAWLATGFQMHHYLLDQYIWRPSRSAQLRKELKLEDGSDDRLRG
jgi:hypothetical protein